MFLLKNLIKNQRKSEKIIILLFKLNFISEKYKKSKNNNNKIKNKKNIVKIKFKILCLNKKNTKQKMRKYVSKMKKVNIEE